MIACEQGSPEALAHLGAGTRITTPAGDCQIDPREELEARGFSDVLPAINRLVVAPDGRIWVRRNALRGEKRSIDVLDAEGRYLGTLPDESPFPIAFLSPDTLITEETDELDVEYLVAYSVGSGDAPYEKHPR